MDITWTSMTDAGFAFLMVVAVIGAIPLSIGITPLFLIGKTVVDKDGNPKKCNPWLVAIRSIILTVAGIAIVVWGFNYLFPSENRTIPVASDVCDAYGIEDTQDREKVRENLFKEAGDTVIEKHENDDGTVTELRMITSESEYSEPGEDDPLHVQASRYVEFEKVTFVENVEVLVPWAENEDIIVEEKSNDDEAVESDVEEVLD